MELRAQCCIAIIAILHRLQIGDRGAGTEHLLTRHPGSKIKWALTAACHKMILRYKSRVAVWAFCSRAYKASQQG